MGNIPIAAGFVPRPRIADQIEPILRGGRSTPGQSTVWALQGGPGLGKTTTAAHLARTYAQQQWFPDGIIWLTLGPKPGDLRDLAGGIIQAFDRAYQPREAQTTVGRLKELLRSKRCLLVLDDVWDPAYARQLIPDGPRCRVLLTTRDAALARELGARIVPVGVLEPDEALALLSHHPAVTIAAGDEAVAREISIDLGLHPLALHLAAMQVASGVGWSQLRDDLRDEAQRLSVLEPMDDDWSLDERRTRSILASFELSVRRLTDEDGEAFAWLGILQEVRLGARFLCTLWSVDRRTAERRLRLLAAKGLLTEIHAGPDVVTYDLHGLLRSFARQQLLRRLMVPLAAAHMVFLDRYRAAAPDGWFDVVDDGYIYDHLAWHLEAAGRSDELFDLLRAESADATQHRWYAACERYGRSAAFLSHLRDARRIAYERFRRLRRPSDVEVVLRCVLLASVSNGVAAVMSEALLVAMVESNLWSLDQTVSRVRQRANRDDRIWQLLALLDRFAGDLGDDVRLEVLDGLTSVSEETEQQKMLRRLLPHIEGRAAMLERAVSLLQRGFAEPDWIRAVTVLRHLVGDAVARTLAMRLYVSIDESWTAWAEAVFAPLLGWTSTGAIESAMRVGYPHQRALALISVADAYPEQAEAATTAAIEAMVQANDSRFDRIEVINAIAPYAERTTASTSALWNGVQHLAAIDDDPMFKDQFHANDIAALAPYLTGHSTVLADVVAVARAFTLPAARATALAALSTVQSKGKPAAIAAEIDELADEALRRDDKATLIRLARALVPSRRDELVWRAFQLTIAPRDLDAFVAALRQTIGWSPIEQRPALARAAIGLLRSSPHTSDDIVSLAWFLPLAEREELFAGMPGTVTALPHDISLREPVGSTNNSTIDNIGMLDELPPSAETIRAALRLLESSSSEERSRVARSLTARALISGIGSWSSTDLDSLVMLSAHHPSALQQVGEAVMSMEDVEKATAVCNALVRVSNAGEMAPYTNACWQRTASLSSSQRQSARLALLPLLSDAARSAAFLDAWNDAEAEPDLIDRARLRSELLAHAPSEERADRIGALLPALSARDYEAHHEDYRASILLAISNHTPAPSRVVADLENIAAAMRDPHNRAVSLAAVVAHLDGARREAAFDAAVAAARHIEMSHYQSVVFVDFLLPACARHRRPAFAADALRVLGSNTSLSQSQFTRLLDEVLTGTDDDISSAWRSLQETLAEQSRGHVLRIIVMAGALLDRLFGAEGAAAITRAILDVGRWFPPQRPGLE